MLAVLGHELFLASQGTTLGERMREPRAGDLVLEITDFGRGWDPNRIGRLVRVEGRPPAARHVIAPLHDPELRLAWEHGEFIALPNKPAKDWLKGDPDPAPERYQPLTDYLLQDGRDRIELTFVEIEALLGGGHLPPSARNPRLPQWWENDYGHDPARAWMAAGYVVEAVDIPGERVRFRAHHNDR